MLHMTSVMTGQALNTELRSNWDDDDLLFFHGHAYSDVWGYADLDGREYAIVGALDYTIFIDVTDPDLPIEVTRIAGGGTCDWRDYKTYSHYAYGVSEVNCNSGLEIFDLSGLPDQVVKVYDSDEFFENVHNVYIDTAQGKLYAVGITSGLADVVVLDLSQDPTSPSLIKNVLLPDYGYVHDIYVRNDTAYCSHPVPRILAIYDFRMLPDEPSLIGQIFSQGNSHSSALTVDGLTLIMSDESPGTPLLIADLSDIESPTLMSTFQSKLLAETGSIPHNPFAVGNDFVVLSYYEDGLQIVKIDDSSQPFLAGYYDTDTVATRYRGKGSWGAYPYLPSGNLLATDIANGLFVVTPNFPLSDCTEDVQVSGIYDHHWEIIAKDTLSADAIYRDSANVHFVAPLQIELEPNFSISTGTSFEAIIKDRCTKGSSKPGNNKKPLNINR